MNRSIGHLLLVTLLASCGGGGSAGSGLIANPVNPPPAANVAPSGKIWHYDKNLIGKEGSAVNDIATGEYRALSSYRFAIPTWDGTRYLEDDYNSSTDVTEIRIRRVSDNGLVDRFVVDGAISDIQFSPVDSNLIRMKWGENALLYTTYAIFDLAAKRVLWADDDANRTRSTTWLPDGRLLTISSTGVMSAFAPKNISQRAVLGSIALPSTKLPFDLVASPKGDLILINIANVDGDGRVVQNDYWSARLDGSNLQQVTDTGGRAFTPIFSPDGQYVAFPLGYGTSDLVSACELRYVPITARKISRSSPEAKPFLGMKDSAGTVYPFGLGCEVKAWLP